MKRAPTYLSLLLFFFAVCPKGLAQRLQTAESRIVRQVLPCAVAQDDWRARKQPWTYHYLFTDPDEKRFAGGKFLYLLVHGKSSYIVQYWINPSPPGAFTVVNSAEIVERDGELRPEPYAGGMWGLKEFAKKWEELKRRPQDTVMLPDMSRPWPKCELLGHPDPEQSEPGTFDWRETVVADVLSCAVEKELDSETKANTSTVEYQYAFVQQNELGGDEDHANLFLLLWTGPEEGMVIGFVVRNGSRGRTLRAMNEGLLKKKDGEWDIDDLWWGVWTHNYYKEGMRRAMKKKRVYVAMSEIPKPSWRCSTYRDEYKD